MTDEQGVTEYAYDAMNGLARVSYPDGTYVEYSYDSSNRLISLQTSFGETRYTYDALNRIATVTDKDGAETRYTYDANGNRSSMTYANGVKTLYTYDSCNRLIKQVVQDTNGTILENYEITLGAAGERLQIVEKNRTVNYTYDELYRLTQETISTNGVSTSTTYTYDAMSNRLSKETTSGTTTYTYNELNQLTASSDATYTYDADGNQIAVQEAARSVTYHYNDLGRMSSAVVQSLGQTTLETYTYNGNGIRIAKNTDGIETRYLIDPNGSLACVLAEYDAGGNLSAYYTRGTELISRETSGEIRYYQYDPNGSVRLLTDASGDISDTYTYDAFGSLIYQTGTSGNSFLFQGEQYDAATGLYYLRARYMNPATGTFTSMDAYQGSTSDPVSLHKYLFANANPVMNSDPSGYLTVGELGAAMLINGIMGAMIGASTGLVMNVLFYTSHGGEIGTDEYYRVGWTGFFSGLGAGFVLGATLGGLGALGTEFIFAHVIKGLIFYFMGLSSLQQSIQFYQNGDMLWGDICLAGAGLNFIFAGISWGQAWSMAFDEFYVPETVGAKGNGQLGEGTKNNFRTQELLDEHYNKHANEFGNITKEQYLSGAQNLVNSEPGGNILTKIRSNGDVIYYNQASNEFAVKVSDGTIRTYFKPKTGIDYFNKQS